MSAAAWLVDRVVALVRTVKVDDRPIVIGITRSGCRWRVGLPFMASRARSRNRCQPNSIGGASHRDRW
jgi:hypothetical protein